jgi:hypothetical protein
MGKNRQPPAPLPNRMPPLHLAFLGIVIFAAFMVLPLVRSNPRLLASFAGAAAALLAFLLFVRRGAARSGRPLQWEFLPRPVHYVQMTMHASIYAYWGWYWREVYHYVPLILAQVVFVYVLDMLVCWSRRDKWILGFGPVPIVFSTNLFLWFRDDWFFLQFLLISTGVLCKEFITWRRDGRRAHIFNPSAIALCLFSIGLLATHSTGITWAEEVAVTLGRPPNIYLEIFLIGLVVQALFSVTLVTLAAAATLYILNVAYTHFTGVYYFVDSNIPAAVFLGLHLLVTDPATSPRSNLAKTLFGAMYGGAVFGMYALLGWLGAPTFYDKLLCVPPLNLLVQVLDRAALALMARLRQLRPIGVIAAWSPRRLNCAHMAMWIPLFVAMSATGFVGGRHPGSSSEFWQKACLEGRRSACRTWTSTLDIACRHGSGRACITLGLLLDQGQVIARNASESGKDLGRACDLGVSLACRSLVALVARESQSIFTGRCEGGDGESCFILASLYYSGHGVPKDYTRAAALFRESCVSGWWRGCGGLAECYRAGQGAPADPAQAIRLFENACQKGIVPSCFSAATMYRARHDEILARRRLEEGCAFRARYAAATAAYFAPDPASPAAGPDAVCAPTASPAGFSRLSP